MEMIHVKKNSYVTEILPHLYLGDIETSQDEVSITSIINLSNEINYVKWNNIKYTDIPLEDTSSISSNFEICNAIIDEYRQNNN